MAYNSQNYLRVINIKKIESYNYLFDRDRVIFLCKLGLLKLQEIESIKKRLDLKVINLFGISIINKTLYNHENFLLVITFIKNFKKFI